MFPVPSLGLLVFTSKFPRSLNSCSASLAAAFMFSKELAVSLSESDLLLSNLSDNVLFKLSSRSNENLPSFVVNV